MIGDIISIVAGVISIILAVYAIISSKKEYTKSQDNYNNTKEILKEIDNKSEQIDRGIQFVQKYLFEIINKLLDQEGKPPIVMQPISLEEIDDLIEGKTAEAKERIAELEATIEKMPRIFAQKDEPTEAKEGDIWLKTK